MTFFGFVFFFSLSEFLKSSASNVCHNVIRKIEQKCFKEELQKQDKETQSKHEHRRVTQSCGVPMAISEGELRIFFSCKREKQQKNF